MNNNIWSSLLIQKLKSLKSFLFFLPLQMLHAAAAHPDCVVGSACTHIQTHVRAHTQAHADRGTLSKAWCPRVFWDSEALSLPADAPWHCWVCVCPCVYAWAVGVSFLLSFLRHPKTHSRVGSSSSRCNFLVVPACCSFCCLLSQLIVIAHFSSLFVVV